MLAYASLLQAQAFAFNDATVALSEEGERLICELGIDARAFRECFHLNGVLHEAV